VSKASKTNAKPKKKNNPLAAAASRKLSGDTPRYTPDQIAHLMMHAEERGEADRVPLDDAPDSWGWKITGPDGKEQILKPTPEILAALERFEREGHPSHD
jgi:hypothetical protein